MEFYLIGSPGLKQTIVVLRLKEILMKQIGQALDFYLDRKLLLKNKSTNLVTDLILLELTITGLSK